MVETGGRLFWRVVWEEVAREAGVPEEVWLARWSVLDRDVREVALASVRVLREAGVETVMEEVEEEVLRTVVRTVALTRKGRRFGTVSGQGGRG